MKIQRYAFLGELPENLQNVKENKGSMIYAMLFLACLCIFMGLLLLIPGLRESILQPAIDALTQGQDYADNVKAIVQELRI